MMKDHLAIGLNFIKIIGHGLFTLPMRVSWHGHHQKSWNHTREIIFMSTWNGLTGTYFLSDISSQLSKEYALVASY